MKILNWIKGKIKQREMKNIKPDKDFKFEENYYGDIDNLNGFKIIYSNNYDKIYHSNQNELSFISSVITIPNNNKTLFDLICLINTLLIPNLIKDENSFCNYNQINIYLSDNLINIFIRGNLQFYNNICNHVHNNIITKYIRNNLFPNESFINCPNEFLNNIYNSITNPFKNIDILFIEEDILCKNFKPVIGLSISQDDEIIDLSNKNPLYINGRYIIYSELDNFNEQEIQYIIDNVKNGNKLLNILHKSIDTDDIDLNIDEIIEE